MSRLRYFHGGAAGLKPGDVIEPSHGATWHVDGCEWCASGSDDNHKPESVFVTTNRDYARYYASRAVRGNVYVVEPLGEPEPSDNDPGVDAWSCPSARVLSVYDRAVELSHAQRRRVFRLMSPAGEHPATTRRMYDLMVAQVQASVR